MSKECSDCNVNHDTRFECQNCDHSIYPRCEKTGECVFKFETISGIHRCGIPNYLELNECKTREIIRPNISH